MKELFKSPVIKHKGIVSGTLAGCIICSLCLLVKKHQKLWAPHLNMWILSMRSVPCCHCIHASFPCAMSLNCRLSVTNLPQLLLKYHDTRGNSECTILYHSSHVASTTAPLMIYLEESLHSDSWRLSRGVTG